MGGGCVGAVPAAVSYIRATTTPYPYKLDFGMRLAVGGVGNLEFGGLGVLGFGIFAPGYIGGCCGGRRARMVMVTDDEKALGGRLLKY